MCTRGCCWGGARPARGRVAWRTAVCRCRSTVMRDRCAHGGVCGGTVRVMVAGSTLAAVRVGNGWHWGWQVGCRVNDATMTRVPRDSSVIAIECAAGMARLVNAMMMPKVVRVVGTKQHAAERPDVPYRSDALVSRAQRNPTGDDVLSAYLARLDNSRWANTAFRRNTCSARSPSAVLYLDPYIALEAVAAALDYASNGILRSNVRNAPQSQPCAGGALRGA